MEQVLGQVVVQTLPGQRNVYAASGQRNGLGNVMTGIAMMESLKGQAEEILGQVTEQKLGAYAFRQILQFHYLARSYSPASAESST